MSGSGKFEVSGHTGIATDVQSAKRPASSGNRQTQHASPATTSATSEVGSLANKNVVPFNANSHADNAHLGRAHAGVHGGTKHGVAPKLAPVVPQQQPSPPAAAGNGDGIADHAKVDFLGDARAVKHGIAPETAPGSRSEFILQPQLMPSVVNDDGAAVAVGPPLTGVAHDEKADVLDDAAVPHHDFVHPSSVAAGGDGAAASDGSLPGAGIALRMIRAWVEDPKACGIHIRSRDHNAVLHRKPVRLPDGVIAGAVAAGAACVAGASAHFEQLMRELYRDDGRDVEDLEPLSKLHSTDFRSLLDQMWIPRREALRKNRELRSTAAGPLRDFPGVDFPRVDHPPGFDTPVGWSMDPGVDLRTTANGDDSECVWYGDLACLDRVVMHADFPAPRMASARNTYRHFTPTGTLRCDERGQTKVFVGQLLSTLSAEIVFYIFLAITGIEPLHVEVKGDGGALVTLYVDQVEAACKSDRTAVCTHLGTLIAGGDPEQSRAQLVAFDDCIGEHFVRHHPDEGGRSHGRGPIVICRAGKNNATDRTRVHGVCSRCRDPGHHMDSKHCPQRPVTPAGNSAPQPGRASLAGLPPPCRRAGETDASAAGPALGCQWSDCNPRAVVVAGPSA